MDRFSRTDLACKVHVCVCVVCAPSLDRFNVCHGVCVYVCKCIEHEYLRTRFHLCNNVSVLYVCICVCAQCFEKEYNEQVHLHKNALRVQATCVHPCTCTLCENSVRNKNPKSLYEGHAITGSE